MFQWLKKYDMYGKRVSLRLENQESLNSLFGLLLTFFTIIGMLASSIYFGLDLLNTSNPNTNMAVINTEKGLKFKLNKTNFQMAISLQDANTWEYIIDDTVYTLNVYQQTYYRQPNGSYTYNNTYFEMVLCSEVELTEEQKTLFKNINLTTSWCFRDPNITIEGDYYASTFSALEIDVNRCANSTENNNKCKSNEEIDKRLSYGYFGISYPDISVDPTNYTDPGQYYLGSYWTIYSYQYTKSLTQYVKVVNVQTDKGWLLQDLFNQDYLATDSINEQIHFEATSNILSLVTRFTTKYERYFRSYTKLQRVAGEIGGFLKGIMMIGQFIIMFYDQVVFYENLTNTLFDFNIDQSLMRDDSANIHINKFPLNNKISEQTKFKLELRDIHNRSDVNLNNIVEANYKYTENLNRKSKLAFGFCMRSNLFIFPCCYRSNNSAKILKLSVPKINKKLDLVEILKQINNIELIKEILFGKDLKVIFECLNKENLFISDEKNSQIEEKNLNILHKAFQDIKTLSQSKLKYMRLLKMVENKKYQ